MRHKHKHNGSVKVTNPQSGYLFRSSETLKHDACVCTEWAYVYRILRKKGCETFLCVRSWGSFKTQHVRLELVKVENSKKKTIGCIINFCEYKTKLLITAHEQHCSQQFVKNSAQISLQRHHIQSWPFSLHIFPSYGRISAKCQP